MQTQRYLSDTFADLSQKSPELINEFTSNAETQRHLIKNGEHLLSKMKKIWLFFLNVFTDYFNILIDSISHFVNSLTTLCHKTMEDTFQTIRNYEAARVEYDAYRFDLEVMKTTPGQNANEITSLENDVAVYKERYENLKRDVQIKMKFLDENRITVMRKQLNQFQLAISIYFSGNNEQLQQTMKQMRELKLQESRGSPESFLESP